MKQILEKILYALIKTYGKEKAIKIFKQLLDMLN
jgi:hypothetical protein